MSHDWPLFGRAEELDFIAGARVEGAGGVVIAGAAGVGKTRLANESVAVAVRAGHASARAVASRSAAQIPLGAFAPFLSHDARGAVADQLRRAAAELEQLALGDRALVLAVDDAHLLDDASSTLLHQAIAGSWCFLIATVRSGEPAPDAITALWKDGLCERLELQPLLEPEVADLLTEVLGGPVDGATAHYLWRATEGNPLYLRELVRSGVDTGRLACPAGLWTLTGPLVPPPVLVELIAQHLDALPEDGRAVVDALTVTDTIGLAILEDIVGLGGVEEAERAGLVMVFEDRRREMTRLLHPLYGDVARARLPKARARAIARKLAEAITATGANRAGDALRVATWRLAGGQTADPAVLVRGAREALAAHDMALAERLSQAAAERGGGAQAVLVLAEALHASGRHETAESVLVGASALALDDAVRARIGATRADNMFRGLGRAEDAIRISEATEARLTDQIARSAIRGQRASFLMLSGRTAEALVLTEPLAEATAATVVSQVAIVRAPCLALHGRTAEAIRTARAGVAAAARAGTEPGAPDPLIHRATLSLALAEAGLLGDAEATARALYDEAVEKGARSSQSWAALCLARVAIHRGVAADTIRWAQQAVAVDREIEERGRLRWSLGSVLFGHALARDEPACASTQDELDELEEVPDRLMDSDIDRARACAALAHGERAKAKSILREAADRAATAEQWGVTLACLHDLARFGDPRAACKALGALGYEADGVLAAARRAHVRALAAKDAPALAAAAAMLAEVGAHLAAWDAETSACAVYRSDGLLRKAQACDVRAAALAVRCPGTAIANASAAPVAGTHLTQREDEVARLAAAGHTSREIADRLFLSVRTVDNHLRQAFTKLGIARRSELERAL